jgi:hypothetical protein
VLANLFGLFWLAKAALAAFPQLRTKLRRHCCSVLHFPTPATRATGLHRPADMGTHSCVSCTPLHAALAVSQTCLTFATLPLQDSPLLACMSVPLFLFFPVLADSRVAEEAEQERPVDAAAEVQQQATPGASSCWASPRGGGPGSPRVTVNVHVVRKTAGLLSSNNHCGLLALQCTAHADCRAT